MAIDTRARLWSVSTLGCPTIAPTPGDSATLEDELSLSGLYADLAPSAGSTPAPEPDTTTVTVAAGGGGAPTRRPSRRKKPPEPVHVALEADGVRALTAIGTVRVATSALVPVLGVSALAGVGASLVAAEGRAIVVGYAVVAFASPAGAVGIHNPSEEMIALLLASL